METPLFFKNNNYNLFGMLHKPELTGSSLKLPASSLGALGIVLCHPFAEEKLIAHRFMVDLARSLASAGFHALRFDYMGHGDSEGNFEDATLQTRLSDIKRAIDYLREQTGVQRVGLLGVRFGATLAALMCADIPEIDPLILISLIIEGKSYINQCLRSNLTTQLATYGKITKDRKQLIEDLMAGLTINIDGYLLTRTLYEKIEAVNLFAIPSSLLQNVLLLQISRRENQPDDEGIKKLYMKYKASDNNAEMLTIKDDYFWTDTNIYNPQKRNIQDAVLNWLNSVL